MPRDTGELLRATLTDMGVPANVDKRVRTYRSSLSAMMGEDSPRQLVDFDNYLLAELESVAGYEPDIVADRLNDAIRDWGEASREDLYGISTETLRDSLIKLEDLSFRDGVRVALEDPAVVTSMFVLLKSNNIDYRKGAIFTLEEAVKRDPACLQPEIFERILQGPYSKEERVMIIEHATEFGRMVGRMILQEDTRERGLRIVDDLAKSGEDTQLRIALKTYTHLSKVEPEHVDVTLAGLGLDSTNDFNRETAARVLQNLCKADARRVPDELLTQMATDRTWAVRQVAANALLNVAAHDPARARRLVERFEAGDDSMKKVAEKARKRLDKTTKA